VKLFVDNLTNIDFSYLHNTRGLIGESWLAQLVLTGSLNQQGMICDFSIVKQTVRDWLDQTVDHVLVVPKHMPNLKIEKGDHQTTIHWTSPSGEKFSCISPACAITLVDADIIDKTSLANWCQTKLKNLFPDEVVTLELAFQAEATTGAFYHYSHGLKKHAGNCQRIAHGHRSKIEIWENNQRSTELEQAWAQRWGDIYIGTNEDLVNVTEISGAHYHTYQYTAEQGNFELTWPQSRCYDIETESTVEFIAQHIAAQLKQEKPENQYRVKAYEGVGKGAIAET